MTYHNDLKLPRPDMDLIICRFTSQCYYLGISSIHMLQIVQRKDIGTVTMVLVVDKIINC